VRLIRVEEGETVVSVDSLAEREEGAAGAVLAAPVEVLAGEEDLSGDAAADEGTVEGVIEGEDTMPHEGPGEGDE